MRWFLSALLIPLLIPVNSHAADLVGKPRIIDGDTIVIADKRIRLHGIDAPESKQTCQTKKGKNWNCGAAATRALAAMLDSFKF